MRAQGPWTDLELHTLGWKAFQDLCSQVCEEVLKRTISIYREAQDGGQDAVFLIQQADAESALTGTVQCKFTSSRNRRLRESDLTREEETVRELVEKGQAYTYILMTNMGIDAPIARALRQRLQNLGVSNAHILGGEFLTWVIRRSARLRALVPRIYGLGDLSLILDERKAEQTKILLGHLIDTLKVYVPTKAHRDAVQALTAHGIVLLLGAPATGKSTIAAILSTTALETENHQVFKCDGPLELTNYWDPHEKGRLYWVDDAFGATQLRSDYVDYWISSIPMIRSAIQLGNRFILTSRRHIYEAAKPTLGTRNHPKFRGEQACVDVGSLNLDERRQILYNHIKAGQQTPAWKRAIKPHLDAIASEQDFVPEIARRLADPVFTTHIGTSKAALLAFVREPKNHLIEVIEELARIHKAALALVYIHRGRLYTDIPANETWGLVAIAYGVDTVSLGEALQELDKSFIVRSTDSQREWWGFKHPTIIDALSEILGKNPELTNLYLRGAHWQSIVSEVVCDSRPAIKDSIMIPSSQMEILSDRLVEIPNEPEANASLYNFLKSRASDECLRLVLLKEPALFDRKASYYFSYESCMEPKLLTMIRANELSILSPGNRFQAVEEMRNKLFEDLDTSFLLQENFLKLFEPRALLDLGIEARLLLQDLPERVEQIEEGASPYEPEESFRNYKSTIRNFKLLFKNDENAQELIDAAEEEMDTAIERLKELEMHDPPEWQGSNIAPNTPKNIISSRSIFSDVAE